MLGERRQNALLLGKLQSRPDRLLIVNRSSGRRNVLAGQQIAQKFKRSSVIWPSAAEMRIARSIMIAAVIVITAALLRHSERIFDFAAVAIVASSGLLYRATHPRQPDGSPTEI